MSYFDVTGGGSAQISTDGTPKVWSNTGSTIGFSIRDHDYVAYAPTGASWMRQRRVDHLDPGRQELLHRGRAAHQGGRHRQHPDLPATAYGRYAHAHVTGTKITYDYSPSTGKVNSTYAFTTDAEGGHARPRPWCRSTRTSGRTSPAASPIGQTYVSPRGLMKNLVGVTVHHRR